MNMTDIEQKALERRAEEALTKAYQEVDEWRRRAWDAETAHEADKARHDQHIADISALHANHLREQAERFSEAAAKVVGQTDVLLYPGSAKPIRGLLSPFILAPVDPLEKLKDWAGRHSDVTPLDGTDRDSPTFGELRQLLAIVKKEAVNG